MKKYSINDIIKLYNKTKEEKYYYIFGLYKYGKEFKTCKICKKSILEERDIYTIEVWESNQIEPNKIIEKIWKIKNVN